MRKILYIGESVSTPSGKREECFRVGWKNNPYSFVDTMRKLELFVSVDDRARLSQICVVWHEGINLLPPNYGGDAWEYNWAKKVAQFIFDRLFDDYGIVYIAGRRSQEAFGLRKVPFCVPCRALSFRQFNINDTSGKLTFVPIPSPSNNSQWWCDEEEITIARHSIQELNKRIALGV